MLRGRLTLASVYLCVVCLLSLTPQPAAKLCTQDIIKMVQFLIGKAPSLSWLDCRLYTPTTEDYRNCPRSTLKCFADEVQVLTEEWEAVSVRGIRRFPLKVNLEKLAMRLNQMESECLRCELLKEEKVEKFLEKLNLTLEMINAQHCS